MSFHLVTDSEGDRLTLLPFIDGWSLVIRPADGPAASVWLNNDQLLALQRSIGRALHPSPTVGESTVRREGTQPERAPIAIRRTAPLPGWVSQIRTRLGG